MRTLSRHFFHVLVCTGICALSLRAGWAQDLEQQSYRQASDPPRWYQEEATPRAYFETLKKEAGAAYGESVNACKHSESAARTACLREAHKTFEQDMADAKTKSLGRR